MFPVPQMFAYYTDLDGSALQNGYVYFGQVSQNPQTNPIPIFWDLDGTLAAPQPLRTLDGYAVRNGTPANIFLDSDYSLSVYNQSRELVYYVASAISAGANLPIFVDPIAPVYIKTISDILNGLEVSLFRFIDPQKYSGIRSNTNIDDLSIQINEAYSSGAKKIFAPYGTYNFGTTLNIVTDGFGVRAEGINATIFQANSNNTAAMSIADGLNGVTLENFRLTRTSTAILGGNGIDAGSSSLINCLLDRILVDSHWNGVTVSEGFNSKMNNLLIINNQLDGLYIEGSTITGNNCAWELLNIKSRNNNGNGISTANLTAALPLVLATWTNVVSTQNKVYGIYVNGSASNSISNFSINGAYIEGNGNDGIFLNTYGNSLNLNNITSLAQGQQTCGVNSSNAATAMGNGINITQNNRSINLSGCSSNLNSFYGYKIGTLIGGATALTGCSALDNGINLSPSAGIFIDNPLTIQQSFNIVGGFYGNSPGNSTTVNGIAGQSGIGVTIIGAQIVNVGGSPINFANGQNVVQCIGYGGFSDLPNQLANLVTGGAPTGVVSQGINTNLGISRNGVPYINP